MEAKSIRVWEDTGVLFVAASKLDEAGQFTPAGLANDQAESRTERKVVQTWQYPPASTRTL